MSALLVEALFAVVFARALVAYVRGRDPLQRDVMLIFGSVAVLFVLDLIRRLGGEPSRLVGDAASVLLLAQPMLTLRLVARVRRVPAWIRWSAVTGWLVSALIVVFLDGAAPSPAAVLLIVAVFGVVEIVAAGFFVREAACRTGSSRVRLWCAAAGTGLFAVALVAAAAGPAGGRASQFIALASAAGFALAFLPPGWLRQLWAARAAYVLTRRLLKAPADETSAATWQHYADAVGELSAADAGVVLVPTPDGPVREVASFGLPAGPTGRGRRRPPGRAAAGTGHLEGDLRGRDRRAARIRPGAAGRCPVRDGGAAAVARRRVRGAGPAQLVPESVQRRRRAAVR